MHEFLYVYPDPFPGHVIHNLRWGKIVKRFILVSRTLWIGQKE